MPDLIHSHQMLIGLRRDRWIAGLLLLGLLGLLVLVLQDYGVGLPPFPKTERQPESASIPISAKYLNEMLAAGAVPSLRSSNLSSPFFTTHFQPPEPPAPTTRKVNMVYQGFFKTADGDKQAFVRVDDTDQTTTLGRPVIADLAVSDIQTRFLTLTNSASRTNILEFNQPTPVEVPVP